MNTTKLIMAFVLSVFFCYTSEAQVLINEISNKNSVQIPDEDNEFEDWIELYNSSPAPVNLLGYYLSDDSLNLEKWAFPAYEIAPQQHMVIFASGKNRKPTPGNFHWESPVSPAETFDYIVPTAETSPNWMQPDFNPTGWGRGNPGFGSGDNDDATLVPEGSMVIYARRTFTVPAGFTFDNVILQVDYDDGFVAYLNGVEIGRKSILGTPSWNSIALMPHEAAMHSGGKPEKISIDLEKIRSLLVPGDNVFAVEVHNSDDTSTDMSLIPYLSFRISDSFNYFNPTPAHIISSALGLHTNFKIDSQGERVYLYHKNENIREAIWVRNLSAGWSVGRLTDGAAGIGVFFQPTPGKSNTSVASSTVREPEPVFSVSEGYYPGTQTVSLSTGSPTAQIRYTTDGSEPTLSSTLYNGTPITMASTGIIRAASFSTTNKMPSHSVTNTYFINNAGHKVPVFSVVTDHSNLYGSTGIFDNHGKEWERPCYVEYFDVNKQKVFEQFSGIEIDGGLGGSRWRPQHSFRLEFDNGLYGQGDVDYELIPDRAGRKDYKSVYMRNGSSQYLKFQFKDAMQSKMMSFNNLNYYSASKPAVVYINGDYFGQYDMREKINDEFFEENYKATIDSSFHLLSLSYFNYSVLRALNGSVDTFITDYNTFINLDATQPDYLQKADQILDLNYYTDYIVGESWIAHTDWPLNNIKAFKGDFTNHKWQFALQDLEWALDPYGWTDANFDHIHYMLTYDPNNMYLRFWKELIKNPTYKKDFINRFADLMNTSFLPENTISIAQAIYDESYPEMRANYVKWGEGEMPPDSYVAQYENDFITFKSELSKRSDAVRTHLINNFDLSGQYELELQVTPALAGVIQINTVTPNTYPWKGTYFVDVPIRLEAKGNGNYVFDGWEPNTYIKDLNNPVIEADIRASGQRFTARFRMTSPERAITISEVNYVSEDPYPASDWVELHNYGQAALDLSGWYITDSQADHKWVFPGSVVLQAGERLVLASDLDKFKAVYPRVTNVIGSFDFGLGTPTDQVKIYNSNNELMAGLQYTIVAPWPTGPYDKGMTLELKDPNLSLDDASNWFEGCVGGSPGTAYISCTTDIINAAEVNKATLYPNPATGQINITMPAGKTTQEMTCRILDVMGKEVKILRVPYMAQSILEVPVSDLSNGVYIVHISFGQDHQSLKFVKH